MTIKYSNWIPMPRFLLRKSALNSILKTLDLNGKECLEIGFGAGEILKFIASKGAKITGFEFSDDAAVLAKNRIKFFNNQKNIHITTNSDEIKHSNYDVVLALEVLEHIKEDKFVFSQWLEYLKPGGSFILSVPAHMSNWGYSDVWAGHYRRYEKSDLIQMCEEQGLKVQQIWNYGYPLTIILDKILHQSKKNNIKSIKDKDISNEELSKKSGIDRDKKLIYQVISNEIVLYPFYLLQKIFFNMDLGSQYILHVKKPNV